MSTVSFAIEKWVSIAAGFGKTRLAPGSETGSLTRVGRILLLAAMGVMIPGVAAASQARTGWFPGAAVPVGLAVTDENGDGAPDVVSGNVRRSVSVLLGRGEGRLRRGVAFRAPGEHEGAAIADLNHDSVADVVLFDQKRAVTVMLADGRGHLRAPRHYPAGLKPWTGTLADVNGDSAPDVVAVDWGLGDLTYADDRLVVLLNNGDGTFGAPAFTTPAPSTELPWALGAADLNGDGRDDIVETTRASSVNVLLSRGDGSFEERPVVFDGRTTGLLVSDLNGDRKTDLAVGNGGEIDIFLGAGNGSFGPPKPAIVNLFAANTIVAGDFNGDGHQDLAAAPFDQKVSGVVAVFLGRGDGTFGPVKIYAVGGTRWPEPPIAAGDLNGDGRADLVAQVGPSVAVLKAQPDGTFSEPASYRTGPPYCVVPYVINFVSARAQNAILQGGCRVGPIHRLYSRKYVPGRVMRQKPSAFAEPEPPRGTPVTLWVSRGPRRHR
jgi:FG-GAP-like repeat